MSLSLDLLENQNITAEFHYCLNDRAAERLPQLFFIAELLLSITVLTQTIVFLRFIYQGTHKYLDEIQEKWQTR